MKKRKFSTIAFLKKDEWTMGNGRCHHCRGLAVHWHYHSSHEKAERIGHEKDCPLAMSLIELGEKPLMMGDFKKDDDVAKCTAVGCFYRDFPGSDLQKEMQKKSDEFAWSVLIGATDFTNEMESTLKKIK